jgi:hypothetical protein
VDRGCGFWSPPSEARGRRCRPMISDLSSGQLGHRSISSNRPFTAPTWRLCAVGITNTYRSIGHSYSAILRSFLRWQLAIGGYRAWWPGDGLERRFTCRWGAVTRSRSVTPAAVVRMRLRAWASRHRCFWMRLHACCVRSDQIRARPMAVPPGRSACTGLRSACDKLPSRSWARSLPGYLRTFAATA